MPENSDTINWYRTPIERSQMRSLTEKKNLPGVLHAASLLLAWLVTFSVTLYFFLTQQWILMIAGCWLHGSIHAFLGMEASVHELSHNTAIKNRTINEIFYRILCFLTWNNWQHFRLSHINHHNLTLHRGRDLEVMLEPNPFHPIDWLFWLTFDFKKCMLFFRVNLAHFIGNADADFFFWNPLLPKDDPRRKKIVRWARIMVIGHLAFIGLFIALQWWICIFLFSFGYFFANFFAKTCTLLQHQGLRSDVDDWRVICHSIHFNPVLAWLYWNMNWHREHHMYAAVPFWKLNQLQKLLAHDLPKPVTSWSAGMRLLFATWKRQKTDKNYCYVPDFPDTATPPRM